MTSNNFFYKRLPFLFVVLVFFLSCKNANNKDVEKGPWLEMKQIVDNLKEPTFPNKNFNVVDFGAVSDGVFDNTEAFQKAIKECADKGGGKVIIPAGKYVSGAIHLKSNVNFHLEEGAEILFSTNPQFYYPLVYTSFEGYYCRRGQFK